MCILSNSSKFYAGRPPLPAYNFSPTMATTYGTDHVGAVASLKFFAIENMTPRFSAHVYYGKMVGWIRIPLGTEVRLSPGEASVLDGNPACPLYAKGHSSSPLFGPLLWPASPQACTLPITRIVD